MRTAGANIARGFFNDFDIDDSRETQVQAFETIQFLVREGETRPLPETTPPPHINMARTPCRSPASTGRACRKSTTSSAAASASAAEIITLEGAARNPRYSSAEMVNYSNRGAPPRRSGRISRNAIIMPIRKTAEWWQKSALERHSYFYPHVDHASASPVKGHALAAEKGIGSLFRRVYHNPDGYERPNEFDFVTYFECDDEALPVFEQVMASLRDFHQNPEWRYVEEGPIWRGRRVLRW